MLRFEFDPYPLPEIRLDSAIPRRRADEARAGGSILREKSGTRSPISASKGRMIAALLLLCLQDFDDRFERLIEQLDSPRIEKRGDAIDGLKILFADEPASRRTVLRKRIKNTSDLEIRNALQDVLRSLPRLKLEVKIKGTPVIGKPLDLEVRIRNVGDRDQLILPNLYTSDVGGRFPKYLGRIHDGDGKALRLPPPLNCSPVISSLTPGSFTTLKPGETFDPFSKRPHYGLNLWKPAKSGAYVLTFTADFGEDPNFQLQEWDGAKTGQGREKEADVLRCIRRIPRVKLVTTVKFTVKLGPWTGHVPLESLKELPDGRLAVDRRGEFRFGIIRDEKTWKAFVGKSGHPAFRNPGLDWKKQSVAFVTRTRAGGTFLPQTFEVTRNILFLNYRTRYGSLPPIDKSGKTPILLQPFDREHVGLVLFRTKGPEDWEELGRLKP